MPVKHSLERDGPGTYVRNLPRHDNVTLRRGRASHADASGAVPTMDDREAHAGAQGGRRSAAFTAGEDAVIEHLVSWSASAHPILAQILESLSEFRGQQGDAPHLLRMLHERAAHFLPPGVAEDVRQAAEAPRSRETSPSVRQRLDPLLARASGELALHIERKRASLSSELGRWAESIGLDESVRVLETLWRTETADTLPNRLAAIEDLRRAEALLGAARTSLVVGLEETLEASAVYSRDLEALRGARSALRSGHPEEVSRARLFVRGLRAAADRRQWEEKLVQVRASLMDACHRVRQLGGETAGRIDAGLEPLVSEGLARSEEALRAGAEVTEPRQMAASCSTLAACEKVLRHLLEEASRAGGERQGRETLSRTLTEQIRSSSDVAATPSAVERALHDLAPGGGRPFQEAVLEAIRALRQARAQEDHDVGETSKLLRASADQLVSVLEEMAQDLPTTQVVEARLHLDQVDEVASSRRTKDIESLNGSLQEDLERLRRLGSLAQRRQKSREQTERQALEDEASRLAEVAGGRSARRLQALAAEVRRANAKQLSGVRVGLDQVGTAVGRAVRLDAGRALRGAERWLLRTGKRPAPKRREPAEEMQRLARAVRSAMETDDFLALRRHAIALRMALRQVSPLSRPALRIALVVVPAAALAATYFGYRWAAASPATYTFVLDPPPQDAVTLSLFHDGQSLDREYTGPGGVSLNLPPGRYEVFVNGRFTGRVVRVPEDGKDVKGIPLPTMERQTE